MTTENTEAATPETDGAERMAYSGEYMVPTEVARRLERERDEARAWAEKLQTVAMEHSIRAEAAERERDEARDMVKRLCKSQFGTNCEFLPMEDEE